MGKRGRAEAAVKKGKAAGAEPARHVSAKREAPEGDPFAGCLNAEIQTLLCRFDNAILGHECFAGLMDDEPTSFCGVPPFDEAMCAQMMEAGQSYVAAVTLFWLNLRFEPQPNVPKYMVRIENLQNHFFSTPSRYLGEVLVCLVRGDPLPQTNKGQLKAVCPPELRDALRKAIGEDIMNNPGDHDLLGKWRQVIRSIPVRFKPTEPDHQLTVAFESSVQTREDIGVLHANMRMSSLLRSYEIMDLRAQLEAGGSRQNKKTLAEHYSKVRFAASSERVSPTLVENCMTLHNNVIVIKEIADICFRFDKLNNNPMDSVDKYKQVAVACDKKKDLMVWSYQMLWDHWCCTDGKDPIPSGALHGSLVGWQGKCLTDLFLFKRSVRDCCFKRMGQMNWDCQVKAEFRAWAESVVACRNKFGTIDPPALPVAGQDADRTLPAAWPPSAEKLLLVMETLVYGYKQDANGVKMMGNKNGRGLARAPGGGPLDVRCHDSLGSGEEAGRHRGRGGGATRRGGQGGRATAEGRGLEEYVPGRGAHLGS